MTTHIDQAGVFDANIDTTKRQRNGVFYTPMEWATKTYDQLTQQLGPDWELNYYIWDTCAGTGNLVAPLKHYDNVFISILCQDEVDELNANQRFNNATIFQYDYLNDDVEAVFNGADYGDKLPDRLKLALTTKDKPFVAILNPPYAEASSSMGRDQKAGVASTNVKKYLKGKAGNQLFAQFLCRIKQELNPEYIATINPMALCTRLNMKPVLDRLNSTIVDGFVFPSKSFHGVSGTFPIGSLLFKNDPPTTTGTPLLKVYNTKGELIGHRSYSLPWSDEINNWRKYPKQPKQLKGKGKAKVEKVVAPPISNAINDSNSIRTDTMEAGSIGYLLGNSSDVQHCQRGLAVFSSVFGNGNGCSIQPSKVVAPPLSSAINDSNSNRADTMEAGSIGYLLSNSSDVQHCQRGLAVFSSVFGNGNGCSIQPSKVTVPPLSSGINDAVSVYTDTMEAGSIGYLLSNCSNVQNAGQLTAVFSSVFGDGHGWSIVPGNIEKCILTFAVRRSVKHTWLNDCDVFTIPHTITHELIYDSLALLLFDIKNQTSAINTTYKGIDYRIINEWFPYSKELPLTHSSIEQLKPPHNDHERFIAFNLNSMPLTGHIVEILQLGEKVYRIFFQNLHQLNRVKYRIDHWDTGWYQIRKSLEEANLAKEEIEAVNKKHEEIKLSIRKRIYEYGFLPKDITPLPGAKDTCIQNF